MYSIGIRVSPNSKSPKLYYAVLKNEDYEFEITSSSYLNIPLALEFPDQLAYIRTNILSIISQYSITNAGLRVTETTAKSPSTQRMNIEGVVQELFANSTIEKYSVMKIAQMTRLLGDSDVKSYIDATKIFAEIEDWNSYKLEERECLIVACASARL